MSVASLNVTKMVFKQIQLSLCIVVPVLLSVWTEVTRGEARIQLTPQYPEIGGSVTFTVTGITGSIQFIFWYKGPESSDDYRILANFPGPPPKQFPGPLFHSRVEVPSSGSLRISNLNRADEGQYRAKVQTDREEEASVTLRVYEAVGKPTITSSSSQPKEYDLVTLTCTSSNAERITWSRVRGRISSGVTFSSDNKTLTWPRITRTDTGAYQCKGENPISSSISDPYTLTVSFSPQPENDNKIAMIIGPVIAVILLIVVGVLIYIFLVRRSQKQSNSTTEAKQPSNYDTAIGPVYENMTALEGNMPKRSKQAMEMDNAVVTGESHYEQLGPHDKAVYCTLIPGQQI